jgi:hypothetical protein
LNVDRSRVDCEGDCGRRRTLLTMLSRSFCDCSLQASVETD